MEMNAPFTQNAIHQHIFVFFVEGLMKLTPGHTFNTGIIFNLSRWHRFLQTRQKFNVKGQFFWHEGQKG